MVEDVSMRDSKSFQTPPHDAVKNLFSGHGTSHKAPPPFTNYTTQINSQRVHNPRYEDYLKKRIQTKLSREGEIRRVSQLASPRKANDENQNPVNIVSFLGKDYSAKDAYRDPVQG